MLAREGSLYYKYETGKDDAVTGFIESETIMKRKNLIILLATVVFVTWCIKGFYLSTNLTILTERSNEEIRIEENKELTALKIQIAQLKRRFAKASCKAPKTDANSKSVIYAITPTHTRHVQKAELTRLSHTLMLVPNLHWIVIEDSEAKTGLVTKLLKNSGISYTHLNIATPKNWKLTTKDPHWSKPRGVLQRNVALDWIRSNLLLDKDDGVLYFLDDDNSYALELFEEMRNVKGVGVWPVGLVGGLMVERPNVNDNGKVVGWHTMWSRKRPFAIDMAGFAINVKLFLKTPNGKFAFEVERGFQESELLKHFVTSLDELEPRADNCTKVYVWHTRTENPTLREEKVLLKEKKPPSNYGIEV